MSSTFTAFMTLTAFSAIFCVSLAMTADADPPEIKYPQARKSDQSDTYFGTTVADPYRWLEDDRSAETAQWVAAENQVTNDYLAKIPYRSQIKARLEKRVNYPRYSAPFKHGKYASSTRTADCKTSPCSTYRTASTASRR